MPDIHEAKTKISEFFQNELGKESEAIRFLKLSRSEGGWEGLVEVTELNEYLKKIGYPPIFDKNRYVVTLDETMGITGYEREEEG